jgi:hypothetical protein
MKGPAPRVLIIDAVMRHYESDIRARLRPGVHLEFAHSTDAIAIARSAHLAGCTVSVIDRVDASAADSSVFYDPARAAVVIDSLRNRRAVALEDTLRLFDLDGDGALSEPELAAAIRVTSGASAESAAKAAADAVASFGQSDRGSLDSVALARYASSPASALGRDLPYGASVVDPATALEVRPSRIYRAGLGLFAASDIAARTIMCEYTGSELTLVETAMLTDFTYLMGGLGLTCHIDAREHPDVLARYINDGGDAGAQNARFVKLPSRAARMRARDARHPQRRELRSVVLDQRDRSIRGTVGAQRSTNSVPHVFRSIDAPARIKNQTPWRDSHRDHKKKTRGNPWNRVEVYFCGVPGPLAPGANFGLIPIT